MTLVRFQGFGATSLEAEVSGDEHDPAILLVHGAGQTRAVWSVVVEGLVQAGRRVINLDLRGHGGSDWPESGAYDLDAHVGDLRAVLAQLGSRPVVVAATLGGWIAALALETDAANLAAGLVLVDMPVGADPETAKRIGERLRQQPSQGDARWDPRAVAHLDIEVVRQRLLRAAPALVLPTQVVRGGIGWVGQAASSIEFDALLPNAEVVEVEDADLLVVTDRTEAFLGRLLDFLERKQPRSAAEFRAGSDARTLRDAMGCFATGVTIVTACDAQGTPIGLTANSFTSVSLDPPLLLVCIANTAGTAPILREASHFGVNVLQTSQQPASNRFAGKGEDRFAATPWTPGETGVPLLDGSLVSFECRRHAVHDGGDHFILVGKVVRAAFEPRRDPLLYFRGKYRRLHFT
ncbi:flavin reductase (DIM6/NTAB) family NADH-FMN oxidoreductase RutF [Novosphingobium kunmingense]|uniref:Flavin reductase (DIM6/NTAB) family NADH-FMN oxidoreductase RutF n=1 Tax=Novosphingobium kunmingense TaxID=1211806 RepID=A0A2N0H5V6_9SPHN|nr:flavin reductase (DIM6/NTAB) family NADH-FMN oxidoreductase RutF [Novosphingobium kunmingense]